MQTKRRYRLRYAFWLNHNDPDEVAVADTIEVLKNERGFASAVRDGVMLIAELRRGETALLVRLFPWIVDALKPAPAPDTNGSGGELLPHIERLERLILASNGGHHATNGNGHHTATSGELPDLVITKSNIDATANFLSSLASIASAASADEARQTRAAFAVSMGDLFGGDDDNDLFD